MKKWLHITLEANCWATKIDEYLWIIYDTTDMEKLDSNIKDKIYLIEKNLKKINTVRVFNGFNW